MANIAACGLGPGVLLHAPAGGGGQEGQARVCGQQRRDAGQGVTSRRAVDHDDFERAGIRYGDHAADFGATWGEVLLEPTRLYTSPLLRLIAQLGDDVHALSHVTGGGIAANLARVLPRGSWVEVDRSTWSPPPVFRVLAELGGHPLESTEGTWNLGIGFVAAVSDEKADAAITALAHDGIAAWQVGVVRDGARPEGAFEQGAKGVDGGAVRLVSDYSEAGAN